MTTIVGGKPDADVELRRLGDVAALAREPGLCSGRWQCSDPEACGSSSSKSLCAANSRPSTSCWFKNTSSTGSFIGHLLAIGSGSGRPWPPACRLSAVTWPHRARNAAGRPHCQRRARQTAPLRERRAGGQGPDRSVSRYRPILACQTRARS